MLNTAIWPHDTGRSTTIYEPALIIDHEVDEVLEPIPAHGIAKASHPFRPYVYGNSPLWARLQLVRVQENLHRYTTT